MLHAAQIGLLVAGSIVTLATNQGGPEATPAATAMAPQDSARAMRQMSDRDIEEMRIDEALRLTRDWPEKQRRQIRRMTELHGSPTGLTDNVMIWRDAAPFAVITLEKHEVKHRFPIEHTDFLMHAVYYDIEPDRVSELIAFDGSVYVDRTGGMLAAKCDTQAHNLLALNLGHDVLSGSRSAKEARREFARIIKMEQRGMSHPYLRELQFEPGNKASSPDPGEPFDMDSIDLDGSGEQDRKADRSRERDAEKDRGRSGGSGG
jgi:hypothetical protein